MLRKNVGKTDQVIRYIVAVLLLVASFFASPNLTWFGILLVLGLVMLTTAVAQY